MACLLAWLVGHLLKHLLDFLNHAKDNTISAMEIIVTLGLFALIAHQAYENNVNANANPQYYERPFSLACVWVVYAIFSGILIFVEKKYFG